MEKEIPQVSVTEVLQQIVLNGEFVADSYEGLRQVNTSFHQLKGQEVQLMELSTELKAFDGHPDEPLTEFQTARRDRFCGVLVRGGVDVLSGHVRMSKVASSEINGMRKRQPEKYAKLIQASHEEDLIPDECEPSVIYV